jgi:hypothetical protein
MEHYAQEAISSAFLRAKCGDSSLESELKPNREEERRMAKIKAPCASSGDRRCEARATTRIAFLRADTPHRLLAVRHAAFFKIKIDKLKL